jgi:integrase
MDKFSFTKAALDALPIPEDGRRASYADAKTTGLQIRVTSSGVKTFCVFRRLKRGQPERVTLGRYPEMTIEQARREASKINAIIEGGSSPSVTIRERKAREGDGLTFEKALTAYVEKKRRGKDGLPLKAQTKTDYLAMIVPARKASTGARAREAGTLFPLSKKSIYKITGAEVRAIYEKQLERSQRRAVYAMQVLRAVLNWHGVKIADNPLSKETAGRDRIVLPPTTGSPNPVPMERIGLWWRVACQTEGEAADIFRFMLLTGARGGEIKPGKYSEGLLVRDVDLQGARAILRDTKNRRDHTIFLSLQALDIARRYAEGKQPMDPLFTLRDPRKHLSEINGPAGVDVTPHSLRATFATIAEGLVSYATLKRMVNHSQPGDVTGEFYIGLGEAQLRTGWQAVADFLDQQARVVPAPTASNVVPLRRGKEKI